MIDASRYQSIKFQRTRAATFYPRAQSFDLRELLNGEVVQPPNNGFDIEVCTVTQRKNGEIVEQK